MISIANQQEPMDVRDLQVFLSVARDLLRKKHDEAET
jgi:hypothetical protein